MKELWRKYHNFILPVITGGLVLLLVLSYLFPNKVLDTYPLNHGGEESREENQALPEGSVISYTMNTGTRPLRGIQPGISAENQSFENGILKYRVYLEADNTLVSENSYPLRELSRSVAESVQGGAAAELAHEALFTYLPFQDYEKCKGDIRIEFTYESMGDTQTGILEEQEPPTGAPALLLNEGKIKGYLVYTHNTYPLVYDLKILVFLFLAVTACEASFGSIKRRNKDER